MSRPAGTAVAEITENGRQTRKRAVAQGKNEFGPRRSAYSDEWYTPPCIVQTLGAFDLDPCAGPMAHAARNIAKEIDGLSIEWTGRVWLNPPYSDIYEWLERFARHGNGVALVGARSETQWFQRLAGAADACLWLRGRVRFERPGGPKQNPTVGSVLVAYGAANAVALAESGLPGVLMLPTRM